LNAALPHATMTAPDSSLSDHASALFASMQTLQAAATNANSLLVGAGFPDMLGSTVDDLRQAIAIHAHLVQEFNVKVRTSTGTATFCTCAATAAGAIEAELERQGDTPCGITVTPVDVEQMALIAAHRTLQVVGSLDTALKDPSLGRALRMYARKHPVRRAPTVDFKSLAANDRD